MPMPQETAPEPEETAELPVFEEVIEEEVEFTPALGTEQTPIVEMLAHEEEPEQAPPVYSAPVYSPPVYTPPRCTRRRLRPVQPHASPRVHPAGSRCCADRGASSSTRGRAAPPAPPAMVTEWAAPMAPPELEIADLAPSAPEPEAATFDDIAVSEPAAPLASPSEAAGVAVPVDMVETIAQRVVAQISEKVVREIAWEVIPDLAEAIIRAEIERLKGELQHL